MAIPCKYSVIIMIAVNLASRDFLIVYDSNDIKPFDKDILSFLFRFKQLSNRLSMNDIPI